MKFWVGGQKDALGWIIPLISLWSSFEFLYAARSGHWKQEAMFPTIPVGVRLTYAELLISLFIAIVGGYYLIRKVAKSARIRIAPSGYINLAVVYLFCLSISVVIGTLLAAPHLFTEARAFLIPGSLLFVFYNLPISSFLEEWVISLFYKVGVVALVFGLLMAFFSPIFGVFITIPSDITFAGGYWMAFYAGVFSWSVSIARLLWGGVSLKPISVVLLALAVAFVYLGNKPIVFTLIVALGTLTIVASLSDESLIRRRAWGIMLSVPSLTVATLILLPQSLLNQLVGVFARRYLKIWSVSSVQDLQDSLSQVGQRQDLSAGRFEIWQSYFSQAVEGYGLAPDGFGGVPRVYMPLHGWMEAFPAHNTIAYIAYHGGLIAAALYAIIIVRFVFEGFGRVRRIDLSNDYLSRPEIVGIFAFVVGIIAVGLVGGPLLDYRLSWFFWFLTAALLKRWNRVSE